MRYAATLRLPLPRASPGEDPEPCDSAPGPSRKVLIVDDDHDVADSLALLLETMGASTRTAYSGAEALQILAEARPELIFVDLGMPGMDGYATAVALRARPEAERAILVALSGRGEERDRRRSMEAGFDFHIVKPIAIEDLERLLSETTNDE